MAIAKDSSILAADIKPLYKTYYKEKSYSNIANNTNMNYSFSDFGFSIDSGYKAAAILTCTTGNAGVVIRGLDAVAYGSAVLLRNISGAAVSGKVGLTILCLRSSLYTDTAISDATANTKFGGLALDLPIKADNLLGSWMVKTYQPSSSSSINSGATKSWAAQTFSISTPTGYTPIGLAHAYSGNTYGYLTGFNPQATSTATMISVFNGDGGQISCTPRIGILYMNSQLL